MRLSGYNKSGDLRLVGGNYPEKGRLEIYHNSTWGTICDDGFETPDATVACRQLGYRTSTSTFYTASGGTEPVWLDDMACDGTERRIDKCSHPGWKNHNCGHGEDVGVRCTGEYGGNGDWGSWSSWTKCSSSCDSGFRTRNRLCNHPVPSSSSLYCNGTSFEVLKCSIARCTVDGSWGGWSMWSRCNATCGGGVKKRWRNCNNPYPSSGGSTCSGMAKETLLCAESNCPVNGDWSEWQVWSVCSSSCGSGNRKRTRLCDNPPPSYGGRFCNGNTLDLDSCNINECPVDGNWSGWSSWNICSATCDGGIQDRNRKCDAPQPSNGGLYCNGTPIESRPCHNLYCKIDGQWGTWQEWETCNTTCGNGTQQRLRKCDSPSPYFGGSECMGLDVDIQICYQDICPDVQLQEQEDSLNFISPVILGIVAVVSIVVIAVITCISLFVFRRFRPGKVADRKRNRSNTENLLELRVTSQQNDYVCDKQNDLYDICNAESIVPVNTQIATDNIETGANANIPCNAGNVEDVYENLKIA
ncbi:HMCN [Mytilus coruscus]|uniref:HMCN n=1 Tax=Mytilus coruscus TaxID=42192 RepID=A0A6J8EUS5_MYTCO|nr:HMCN [Mytilus coruscus]